MPATAPRPSKPAWRSLSPQQQQALKPLAAHWETLNSDRKRKWLEISKNYFALPVAEQEKMHGRMREWVLMGQQQRNRARLNFAEFQRLTPEEKSSQWQAYQALTLEEKRQLAATAPKKPVGAAAIKPVPPQKLTVIPVTRNTPKEAAPASSALTIQRNTLLPQPPPAPSPVESTPEQAEQTEHTDNKDSH